MSTGSGLVKVDERYLLSVLRAMVAIDSRNPSLVENAPGEAHLGAYVAKYCQELGLEPTVQAVEPGRVNVVATLKGAGGGRSLMLNGHLDTVGVAGMTSPFTPEVRGDRLYGRGAQDMKASLAAMLGVVKALRGTKTVLAGDLILSFVADEEHSSIGTEALLGDYTADAAIVTEPTDLKLCTAHRGFSWYEIETIGRAAHGSRYEEGIDANLMMGQVLARLHRLAAELLERAPHPLAGPPSLHVPLIQGGTEISTYAAHSQITIERRTIPSETQETLTQELQAMLDDLAAHDTSFKANLKVGFGRSPFEASEESRVVEGLERAATSILGQTPERMGATFWTDAALFADAGIDTVLFGPIGAGLHSTEEWVDLPSVTQLCTILAQTAIDFCGEPT